jgi:Fe-S oxidoreductase
VVTGCPYCARTFNNQAGYSEIKNAGRRIIHLSEFLQDFNFGVTTPQRVTYHDPCDLGRHCKIYEAPRQIIQKIAPDFIELDHNRANALCCGAGGGVRGAFAKNSIAMARRRLAEVEASGADILLTECNSCVHNLNNAKLRSQKFRIYTTTQFINQLLREQAETA